MCSSDLQYIHDQWARDTLRDMGQPSAPGRFVHVYLNGLYWGLYNLLPRPDASFAAEVFGGKKADYDVLNGGRPIDGDRKEWERLMKLVEKGAKTPADLAAIEAEIDVDNFIDYMLFNFYAGNIDWDYENWYAIRKRAGGRWRFLSWDEIGRAHV